MPESGFGSSSERKWWIRRGAEVRGPFPEAQVKEWIRTGSVRESMAFSLDNVSWRPGFGVPELFPGAAPSRIGAGVGPRTLRGGPADSRLRERERTFDPDAWFRVWAMLAGAGLAAWVFLPIIGPGRGGRTQTTWMWELLKMEIPFKFVAIFLLLPLELCIAAFLTARKGEAAGPVLFFLSVVTVMLMILLGIAGEMHLLGSSEGVGAGLALLVWLSMTAVAAGNHARKRHPSSNLARLLAGVGGVLLLVSYVIPVNGHVQIELLFTKQAWTPFWAGGLLILGMLAYGVMGVLAFRTPANVRPQCGATSLVARLVIFGFPLLLLVNIVTSVESAGITTSGDGPGLGSVALIVVKMVGLMYGMALAPAIGLGGWIGGWLDRNAPRVSSEELAEVFR